MQKDKVNTTRPPPTNLHIIMVMCYMYITKKKRLSWQLRNNLLLSADTNAPWTPLWWFHEQLYCPRCLLNNKEVIPNYNAVYVLKHIKCRCYIIYVVFLTLGMAISRNTGQSDILGSSSDRARIRTLSLQYTSDVGVYTPHYRTRQRGNKYRLCISEVINVHFTLPSITWKIPIRKQFASIIRSPKILFLIAHVICLHKVLLLQQVHN